MARLTEQEQQEILCLIEPLGSPIQTWRPFPTTLAL